MNEERNFDDLEQFLQSELDDQKMYPSDKVWSNISKQIQPKRSWPALTVISLFILGSLGVATLLNYPPENPLSHFQFSNTKSQPKTTTSTTANKQSLKANMQQHLLASASGTTHKNITIPKASAQTNNAILSFNQLSSDLAEIEENKQGSATVRSSNAATNRPFEKGILASIGSFTELKHQPTINKILKKSNPIKDAENGTEPDNLKGKLDYEVYGTPSFSFRTLAEDKVVNGGTGTTSANSKVNQKAGLGSELGIGLRYKSSKDFTLKLGLQFNIRQYYIDAFSSPGTATIEVLQNNKIDSLNVISKYGNNTVGSETRLNNRLYQVSVPIGIEWSAFHTKHIGLSLSASIQPTFSLNKNVYIISTDYKYYANGESLFRKWNVNSSISANFSYKLKNTTLFVGPQIRYQHLPTYVDKYPIKEYRVDYGLKVGIIKSLR